MGIAIIFFFLSVLIPGWLILALWFDEETRGFFKKASLAYGLGLALLTMEIFVIVFVLRLSVQWLWLILALETLALSYLYYRRHGFDLSRRFKTEPKKVTWKESLLVVLLSGQVLAVASLAWFNPVMNWDSVAMWSFKAKVLFYHTQAFFTPGSQWFWQNQVYPAYPWLVSLAQYWLAILNKGFDEVLVNFIFVGWFVALIGLFYGYLRNYLNRGLSLLLVCLLATMPLISHHAYNAYADLPLSFYLAASFIFTYKWLDTKNNKYLTLAGLLAAAAFFTKNEAIIFIMAEVLVLLAAKLIFKIKVRTILLGWLAAVLAIAPWLVFKLVNKLSVNNAGGDIAWHPQVIEEFFNALFIAASWNIWWYIFFGLSVLFIKQIVRNKSLALAYALWGLFFGGFLVLNLFTEVYQWAVNGTTLSRTMINLAPGSIFLLGLLLRREFFYRHSFFKH